MDKEEFSRKVLEAESSLYHVSKGILINEADCEDAVQEAILKAYAKRNSLKEMKYFKTWLIRILLNECYQFLRAKKQEVSYDDYMLEIPAEQKPYSELYDAIQKLDIKHKMPVILCYIEGYSVNEIAKILRIPSGMVKSRRYFLTIAQKIPRKWRNEKMIDFIASQLLTILIERDIIKYTVLLSTSYFII